MRLSKFQLALISILVFVACLIFSTIAGLTYWIVSREEMVAYSVPIVSSKPSETPDFFVPPSSTPTPSISTGVSRDTVQKKFQSDFRFKFKQAEDVRGYTRFMGENPEGAMILLTGSPDNLVHALLILPWPKLWKPEYIYRQQLYTRYGMALVNTVLPNWDKGAIWFQKSLNIPNGKNVRTKYENILIETSYAGELVIFVMIEDERWRLGNTD